MRVGVAVRVAVRGVNTRRTRGRWGLDVWHELLAVVRDVARVAFGLSGAVSERAATAVDDVRGRLGRGRSTATAAA